MMTLREALAYVKSQGPDIGKLVQLGDKEALRLFKAYSDLHADQNNPAKQTEFIHVSSEYMRRDLNISERADLATKFGHKTETKKL